MKKNYLTPSILFGELEVSCLTTSSEHGIIDFPIDWVENDV